MRARSIACKGLLGLSRVDGARADRPARPEVPALPPCSPAGAEDWPTTSDIFGVIRRQDVLLHHPFQSFQPVVDFLQQAAHDPDVLAIKIVLYRVGRNSPVVEALLEAIEEGKQVAVLMELKARFDEESNIEWARALEHAGVPRGLRPAGAEDPLQGRRWCCGAKAVRSGPTCTWRPATTTSVTAHLYTDIGLFTCDPEIARGRDRPVQLT